MGGLTRRNFLATSAGVASVAATGIVGAAVGIPSRSPFGLGAGLADESLFKISLAEWSLHRSIGAGKLDNLSFPRVTREEFGIEAVEYVNQFFKDKARDEGYLATLKKNCEEHGVQSVLIMVDGEGQLGNPAADGRKKAVENHFQWVDAAKFLGCHSIRVNAGSSGSYDEQAKLAADGLRQLCEYAAPLDINVIVENHGGLSSNGQWLARVIRAVNMDNCGTLPDFGNFRIGNNKSYDRYVGVSALMPFAKGVSAKSHQFDDDGNETGTDYVKMLQIVVDAGYGGFIGIEFEGGGDEYEGVHKTKALLERVRRELKRG